MPELSPCRVVPEHRVRLPTARSSRSHLSLSPASPPARSPSPCGAAAACRGRSPAAPHTSLPVPLALQPPHCTGSMLLLPALPPTHPNCASHLGAVSPPTRSTSRGVRCMPGLRPHCRRASAVRPAAGEADSVGGLPASCPPTACLARSSEIIAFARDNFSRRTRP